LPVHRHGAAAARHQVLTIAGGRYHDHGHVAQDGVGLEFLEKLKAVHERHHQVEQDGVGPLRLGLRQRLGAIVRRAHTVVLLRGLQEPRHHLGKAPVVVRDDHVPHVSEFVQHFHDLVARHRFGEAIPYARARR